MSDIFRHRSAIGKSSFRTRFGVGSERVKAINSACISSYLILAGSTAILDIQTKSNGKGKAIPLQAWTGPEGSRRLKLPDFKTIGT
jgi:hypothetical protein